MSFQRVCLKVKYLRKGLSGNREYDNLREWIDDENNYLAIRSGRVFINKKIFHYRGSILSNPYAVKKYGIENCLNLYHQYINNPTEEMLEEMYFIINNNIKYIGCYCEPDSECHVDLLISKLNLLINEN